MRRRAYIRAANNATQRSGGFSLIELLIVVAIILIIAAIAIPNLIRSRIAANEAAAVENIRTITTASIAYNTTWDNGFPPTIQALGSVGSSTTATCDAAILIDSNLATPPSHVSGYAFAYTGGDGNALQGQGCSNPGFEGFLVTATPITEGLTGNRSFCANEPSIIYFDTTGNTAASESACVALPVLQ